jgi:hypothetical protein
MTVAELVRKLQALGIEAQDLPVLRRDKDWGGAIFVKKVRLAEFENNAGEDHAWEKFSEYHEPETNYFEGVAV